MMRSKHYTIEEWDTKPIRKIPSLVDLCVQKAVDNVRYLGDVGETDFHLLERFLPHCTVEQLMHIEDSTEDRDLSPVTDKLWKNFYVLQFGANSTNVVVERMKEKRVSFKWRQLYEAKVKDNEEAQQKSFERIKQLYKKENARGPSSNIGNTKSGIMKKAKLEFLNSREVKNLSAMKKTNFQNNQRVSPIIKKPSHFPGKSSSTPSSSKFSTSTSTARRF